MAGSLHRIGNLVSFWILTANGRVISRTTVQRVTNLELSTEELKERSKDYNDRINKLLKDDDHDIQGNENEIQLQDWDGYTAETISQRNMVSLCLTPCSRRLMPILRLTRLVIGI